MARALPNATMHVIEGAGHAAHLERPEAVHAAVLDFLRRVHSAAAVEASDVARG
jgi:pimeloyl-ACP methyl ester carboxylesterase